MQTQNCELQQNFREMPEDDKLSAGETAIYDRQIRLWGSNAQLRIKSASVLFIGMTPSTVEIAKNTVLAGCNVFVEDDRHVNDSTTNFLIQLEIDNPQGMIKLQHAHLPVARNDRW